MPIPTPNGQEEKKGFLSDCMGDSVMVKEFDDSKQRYAVCQSKWKKAQAEKQSEWKAEDENSDVVIY